MHRRTTRREEPRTAGRTGAPFTSLSAMLGVWARRSVRGPAAVAAAPRRCIASGTRAAMVRHTAPCCHGHGYDSAGTVRRPAVSPQCSGSDPRIFLFDPPWQARSTSASVPWHGPLTAAASPWGSVAPWAAGRLHWYGSCASASATSTTSRASRTTSSRARTPSFYSATT